MIRKQLITLFIACFFSIALNAQNYFQQEVNYVINVSLDDEKNELTANESIEYINNSPDELSFIYMHLWPNAYKDNSTPMAKEFIRHGDNKFYFAKKDELGYIDQLDFKIDGLPAKYELLKDSIDICKLYLNQPLKSGGKITITTPFHVKIPSGKFSRLGHIGQSYQITQWYPKPAVYDRNGWNYIPYLTQGEFYSEFGSFDVSITLPKNYVLGATGDMIDGEKEQEWLNQKVKETEAISEFNSKDLAFPASDTETKTLRFKQKNVHDFAWFCDKRYHVLKGEVETPHTKHKVTTWVMFTNAEGNLWKKAISYVNDAVYYYSLWNGDYPYNHCTAVDGTISAGGGMEYPNITVIGSSGNAFMLDVVIAHEVGHNWFYGMLGSNERTHPWMDEGINSFNELRYVRTKYPNQKLVGKIGNGPIGKVFDLQRYLHKSEYELGYLLTALRNDDQPVELPAYKYSETNYGCIVYFKSAIIFDYLMAVVGEKEMEKAMQHYFDQWHFKHPQPADIKNSLEESTGKDLTWFFDNYVNSTRKVDYKIKSAHVNKDGEWKLKIKNKGNIVSPFIVQGIKDGQAVKSMAYEGFSSKKELLFPNPSSSVDKFKIDFNESIPEINRKNNTIRTHGVFKKAEPLRLQFLASIDNPDKTQLFYTPVMGWNNYNKWMLGIAFYNHALFVKKFEFELMPMYSFGTQDIAGYGHFAYNISPEASPFQRITLGVVGTRYAYSNAPFALNFNKIAPEVNILFKKRNWKSNLSSSLKYRNISIFSDDFTFDATNLNTPFTKAQTLHRYNDLSYKISGYNALHFFEITANLQEGGQRNYNSGVIVDEMTKFSVTANYNYKFKRANKGVWVRLFAGTFVNTSAWDATPYHFRLSGQNGYQDYLYDNIYLGRTEPAAGMGLLDNQFSQKDGAFKFYSPIGQTGKWMTAMNIESSLGNLKLPLRLYADVGTTASDALGSQKILYDGGVCLSLGDNLLSVYFPVLLCKDFQDYQKTASLNYAETIRFTLNLNMLNPFELVKNFSF